MEPTHDRSQGGSAARTRLERGFRLEQGGSLNRAMDVYRDALQASTTAFEGAEAHLRIARVLRTMASWTESRAESDEAIRIAEEIGADDLMAEAMNVEVGALQICGDFDAADALAERAILRAR